MVSKTFELNLENGMHARPAGLFVKKIGKLDCKVEIEVNDRTINGKSIMAIISLGMKEKEKLEIRCDGTDELVAIEKIQELFEANFNE